MYKLYHGDDFITESDNKQMIWDAFTNHVRNKLKVYPRYYRIVRIEDDRVMIDYGSHTRFYYVLNTEKNEKFEDPDLPYKL